VFARHVFLPCFLATSFCRVCSPRLFAVFARYRAHVDLASQSSCESKGYLCREAIAALHHHCRFVHCKFVDLNQKRGMSFECVFLKDLESASVEHHRALPIRFMTLDDAYCKIIEKRCV
jgi:hypothetical protein